MRLLLEGKIALLFLMGYHKERKTQHGSFSS